MADCMHALNMPLKPPLDRLLFQGSYLCRILRNILTNEEYPEKSLEEGLKDGESQTGMISED